MTNGINFFSNLGNSFDDKECFSQPLGQFFSDKAKKQYEWKHYSNLLENSTSFTKDKIATPSYLYDDVVDIFPEEVKAPWAEDEEEDIQSDEFTFFDGKPENEQREFHKHNAIHSKNAVPNGDNAKEPSTFPAMATTGSKNTAVRMQEIEEILMAKVLIRIISGNLCIWNGCYYRQLNYQLFAQEVRKHLPQRIQKGIGRYNVIKEAFDYMNANSVLQNQFSEKDIATAKRLIVFRNGFYDAKKTDSFHLILVILSSLVLMLIF